MLDYTEEQLNMVSDALLRAATGNKPDVAAIKFIVEQKHSEDSKVDEILALLTREANNGNGEIKNE